MRPGIEHTALFSYFNASMRPAEILSELLDNAFDSGADAINIEISSDGIAVCDNGSGIEDMEKMFRIGASGRHSDPTAIGRYGVGGKHALLAVGSVFDIATRRGDKCIEAKVNWMKFARMGFEQIPDPLPVPMARLRKENETAMEAGWNTRVAVLKKHNRRTMTGTNSILKQLALRYRPALIQGARITLTAGDEIYDLQDQPYANPKISDIVEEEITIRGKSAHVRAGRTEKHVPGMTGRALISYGPRVIETPTDLVDGNILCHELWGTSIETVWAMDAAFLDLFRKAELVHLTALHQLVPPEGKKWEALKVSELKAEILARADQVRRPAILQDIYADVAKPYESLTDRYGYGGEDETDDDGEDADE